MFHVKHRIPVIEALRNQSNFPGKVQFNFCQAKKGGFRYLTTQTVAFHTVSRDTSIYLSWFKNTGIYGLT